MKSTMRFIQAKSNGLLEVIVLIGGERRKRNVPGAAFQIAKDKTKVRRFVPSPLYPAGNSNAALDISAWR